MTAPATKLYKGIEASLQDKASVTELYIEAREADEFSVGQNLLIKPY